MKRMPAVILLSLVVIAICLFDILYVDHAAEVLCGELQACIDAADRGDMVSAVVQLKKTTRHWEESRGVIMMFMEQDLMDEVDNQLEYIQALANHHPEEFVPAVVLCAAQLREMQKRERISLASWF